MPIGGSALAARRIAAGCLPFCLCLSLSVLAAEPAPLVVSDFAEGDLAAWERESFEGETTYRLVEFEGQRVLRADSRGTASGLVRRIEVDLEQTPWLRWSWRVERPLAGLAERTREGDDYAARLYLIQSGGAFFWRTRAVNYVWSGSQPAGQSWPNAFTDRSCMIAVRGTGDRVGFWYQEERDVREDFRRCFGIAVDRIDAVALMSDTDNSQGEAAALYRGIEFLPEQPAVVEHSP